MQTVDDEPVIGHIRKLTGERIELEVIGQGERRLEKPVNREWTLDDVISIDRVTLRPSSTGDDPSPAKGTLADRRLSIVAGDRQGRLWLGNGDRIAVELLELNDEQITVRVQSIAAAPTWTIPLEMIRGFVTDFDAEAPIAWGPTTALRSDIVSLANGDRLSGELLNFANGQFEFETTTGKHTLPLGDIEGFEMNPDLIVFPAVSEPRILLMLRDGSYLTLKSLATQESSATGNHAGDPTFIGRTLFDQEVNIASSDLLSIAFWDRRIVPLSELKAADYQFTPFFSTKWEYQLDRNAGGGPLMIARREYVKGLGLHSQCRVTYQLDGRFQRLQARAGIDDTYKHKGQALISVLIDGEPRIDQLPVKGGEPAIELRVDQLDRARELTISVEFGPFGDVGDHVDIVDPILILAPAR
ncbi:MAG: NPCBM/NEW2 domain-containing protein [Planctomycetaceae bacterium]